MVAWCVLMNDKKFDADVCKFRSQVSYIKSTEYGNVHMNLLVVSALMTLLKLILCIKKSGGEKK